MSPAVSVLHERAEQYVAMRRSLGYKFISQARMLAGFADYLAARGDTTVTVTAALAWTNPADPPLPCPAGRRPYHRRAAYTPRSRHRAHPGRCTQPSHGPQAQNLDRCRPRLRGPAHRHAYPVPARRHRDAPSRRIDNILSIRECKLLATKRLGRPRPGRPWPSLPQADPFMSRPLPQPAAAKRDRHWTRGSAGERVTKSNPHYQLGNSMALQRRYLRIGCGSNVSLSVRDRDWRRWFLRSGT